MNAKLSFGKGLLATLCALILFPAPAWASNPTGFEGWKDACKRLQLAPECRMRVEELLRGREAMLEYLPLTCLASLTMGPAHLELGFDFGKKKEKSIRIPAARLWAVDKKGRLIEVETEEKKVLIQKRVRIEIDAHGELRLRKGDLQFETKLADVDLTAYTIHQPKRLVRDEDGNVILCVDAQGRPIVQDGQFVARTCDQWLVIEGAWKRFEIPLTVP